MPSISQQTTEHWNRRKLSQCYALLTEFSSKTRKCLVRQGTGASGNSLPVYNKALELVEISCQQATRRWNERKFLPRERRESGTGGNSFTANDGMLELVEILSQRATRHWSERKFVHSKRQGVGTDRNSLPASDERLEPSEICSQHAREHWNWWKTSASFTK